MSRHTVKFDGGRYSVLCDGVVVDELPLHQETEQLREQLDAEKRWAAELAAALERLKQEHLLGIAERDAARDAERAATEAWKRLLGDEAKARAELDAANADRARLRAALEGMDGYVPEPEKLP